MQSAARNGVLNGRAAWKTPNGRAVSLEDGAELWGIEFAVPEEIYGEDWSVGLGSAANRMWIEFGVAPYEEQQIRFEVIRMFE